MKLNSLQSLRGLEEIRSLPNIKPLTYKRVTIDKNFMSAIDLILYSTNLCLFSARILRDEIKVKNRRETLHRVNNELLQLNSLLNKDDYYLHNERTHKDAKRFFKNVGLKQKHIAH